MEQKQPKLFSKGLFTDTNEEFQPEGTYRYMLNGILESINGDKGSITNELGNQECFTLPEIYIYNNYILIGACLLTDNRIVLFLTNDSNSIIGIQNTDCTFDVLIDTACLNFDSSKPIDCLFKLHNGCDYYIYFTDNLNKYKSINLNNLSQYKPDGVNWDCGLMNMSPDFNIPDIYFTKILKGGLLKIGAYQFTLRYLDDNSNPTNWCFVTNPIYITQPPENTTDLLMNNGGYLNVANLDGFFYTNKSIELQIENLDTRYKYYQLGILESTNGLSTINGAYITNNITIESSSDTFVLSEINPLKGINSTDPSEITVPNLFVNIVAAHTQVENKLIIANHTEQVKDWSDFQRAANEIQTEYFVFKGDDISSEDSCDGYTISEGVTDTTEIISVTTEGTEYLNTEVEDLFVLVDSVNNSFNPILLTTVNSAPTVALTNPYDVLTGFYTVPLTYGGYYQFTYVIDIICLDNIDPKDVWVLDAQLKLNNTSTIGSIVSRSGTGNETITITSGILTLSELDTVSLHIDIFPTGTTPGNVSMNVTLSALGSLTYSGIIYDNNKNYSLPVVSYDNKTYMRDEVYALGIVYVFKDGSESPVMHIPGRIKIGTPDNVDDTSTALSVTIDGYTYDTNKGHNYWNGLGDLGGPGDVYNVDAISNDWDNREYSIGVTGGSLYQDTSGAFEQQTEISKCEYVGDTSCMNSVTLERWEHVNTSIKNETFVPISTGCKHTYDIIEEGAMGYYDANTTYPDIRDCTGLPIFPHDEIVTEIEGEMITTYIMHNIRHHMIPDARKVPIHSDDEENPSSESCHENFDLYPIGIKYTNVTIPTGFEDEIQGYYFVRGDRAGNKTVIDKGWMNVTDVTFGVNKNYEIGGISEKDDRTIEQNKWFLTPGWKNGFASPASGDTKYDFKKAPQISGWNVTEFFSPKSSMNEIANLGGDYYKMERTLYGWFNIRSKIVDESDQTDWVSGPLSNTTDEKWKLCMYGGFNKSRLPRQYTFTNRENMWYAPYKLPIQGSEYQIYNENNLSTVFNNFKLLNTDHRQTMMISKLFYSSENSNECNCSKPQQTAKYSGGNIITSGVEDIIPWDDIPGSATNGHTAGVGWAPSLWEITDHKWIQEGQQTNPWGEIGAQFDKPEGSSHFCRHLYSPYAYYVALKVDIKPYQKLESIKYIRTTNYLIETDPTTCFGTADAFYVAGGDCFITRQQLYKSYAVFELNDAGDGSANTKDKLAGSLLWGYVESEINSHYRHKESGDDYYVYPWNTIDDTIYQSVDELQKALRNQIEQLYHYRLDYSKDNDDRQYFPLADQFSYCSDCSGRFPNMVYYSDTSFQDEIRDFYRVFKVNNNRTIPADTGDITNLIIKEQQLMAFTSNNLWKFNISPQQLQTNNDVVQVGQGAFLATKPVKLFDNKQGTSRGGCEFKFSGTFADDSYFWVDSKSSRVYRMQQSLEEVSLVGNNRFFRNNLGIKFLEQFRSLSGGLEYPILATTSPMGVGYHSVHDPQFNRYILHKRDFTITAAGLDESGNIRIYTDTGVALEPGELYYYINTSTGVQYFFQADDAAFANALVITQFESLPQFFKTESFTISYSINDKVWCSFHSYLPTFMYNDSNTFFSYYAMKNDLIDITWKHNVDAYTTYCNAKSPFIIDYINNASPYSETTFDNIEYTSNVFEYNPVTFDWNEIQLVTFDQMYVYNNNQISGLKSIVVSNQLPYKHIQYNVNETHAVKERNYWRINKFRDLGVDRLSAPTSMFSKDWNESGYRNIFTTNPGPGVGYIDKIINPDFISTTKSVYKQQRFTDKYLGVRLSFKPSQNYKINFNFGSNMKRNKL
jgi:hypothetical protein